MDQNTSTTTNNFGTKATVTGTLTVANGGGIIQQSSAGLNIDDGGVKVAPTVAKPVTETMELNSALNGSGNLAIHNLTNMPPTYVQNNSIFSLTFSGNNSAYTGTMLIEAYDNQHMTKVIVAAGSNLGSGSVVLTGSVQLANGSPEVATNQLLLTDAHALDGLGSLTLGGVGVANSYWGLTLGEDITLNGSLDLTINDVTIAIGNILNGVTIDYGTKIGGSNSTADIQLNSIFGAGMFVIANIPEPATWLLLSVGAVTLLALRRRRR
ncbi:MAG: PEP-CTERM sorting domain-containing protein [Verrucomicrobiales bacterium]|nr:PEP-CTERM sorting domain-containing protein [Verrucomicrobiales bacterium]